MRLIMFEQTSGRPLVINRDYVVSILPADDGLIPDSQVGRAKITTVNGTYYVRASLREVYNRLIEGL